MTGIPVSRVVYVVLGCAALVAVVAVLHPSSGQKLAVGTSVTDSMNSWLRARKMRTASVASAIKDDGDSFPWSGYGEKRAQLEDGSIVHVPKSLFDAIESVRASHCARVEYLESQVKRLMEIEKGGARTVLEKLHLQQAATTMNELTGKPMSDVDYPWGFTPFYPTYTCPDEERIGGPLDGGKWVCGPRRLPRENCVVYSIGSNGVDDFEQSMYDVAPQCEMHTFDPGDFANAINVNRKVTTYHQKFLMPTAKPEKNMTTLTDVMHELGHNHIDVFKVDIEGGEFGVFPALFSDRPGGVGIGQLQLELHGHPTLSLKKMRIFFRMMFDMGFELFHIEINLVSPYATELAFINRTMIPREFRQGCDRNIVLPPETD